MAEAAPPAAPLRFVVVGASEIGDVREHNEDHLLVGDLDTREAVEVATAWEAEGQRGPLLVVCDGMGGVEGGEVASELAARAIWREMAATPNAREPEVFARLLRRATRVANHDVYAMGKREPGLRGMGTTVSAAGICDDRLIVATVGDSRAYILRDGALVQVTRDQSLSSALQAAGHSAMEVASAGGAILQALGVGADVDPSLSIIELRAGDRVLLCSDGLHGLIGDPAIAILLSQPHTVAHAVKLLVAAARAAGGTDNITAIVCEVSGDRLRAPDNDDDVPTFREFDPQKEGDVALSPSSIVARRLAARVGISTSEIPTTIPVTGQHAILRSQIDIVPPRAVPARDLDGPARARLKQPGQGGARVAWYWWAIAIGFACALAWWLGGR